MEDKIVNVVSWMLATIPVGGFLLFWQFAVL